MLYITFTYNIYLNYLLYCMCVYEKKESERENSKKGYMLLSLGDFRIPVPYQE